MSAGVGHAPRPPQGCAACARRSWLLGELSAALDLYARDSDRLVALLALPDEELLRAVAGRRARELEARYAARTGQPPACAPPEQESVCRHGDCYPTTLRAVTGPALLHVAGGSQRLAEITARPVVAILGSTRASDYGMQVSSSLGRGLAASGVTLASTMADGIAAAAHAGALERAGATIAVLDGGLGRPAARRRRLAQRVCQAGCAISELAHDVAPRRWAQLASQRLTIALAQVVVVVEASERPRELAGARMAQALDRTLGAVPGRVTSTLSAGTNALLTDGAVIIRSAADVLELLEPMQAESATAAPAPTPAPQLDGRLRWTLDQVGQGCDTARKLTLGGADPAEVLMSLTELELMGLLARGDGGRYIARELPPPPSR
ncbi:MAG: processing protein [Solirubrobacteraceae bacterium]|nr:processing protein [Solirubrobacteraceae bacterium]